MRAKKETSKQRRRDRNLAMTALAASGAKKGRNCLSVQEMAELVDGRCSKSQQRAYLEHLGQCDRCYREWAALRHEVLESGGQRLRRALLSLLATRKGLSITGSAVGVAAAVIIFLNIRPAPMLMQSEEKALPQGAFQKMEHSMTVPAETPQQEPVDDLEQARSSPAPEPRREKKKEKALLRDRQPVGKTTEKTTERHDTGGATAPAKSLRAAGSPAAEALSDAQMAEGRELEEAQAVSDSLLRALRRGCGEQKTERSFWRDLQERFPRPEGQRLREAIGDEKFAALSSLVGKVVEDGEAAKHCPTIERIVSDLLP